MHPAGTDWPCRRIAGGRGRSTDAPCAGLDQAPAAGTSSTAVRRLARPSDGSRGTTGRFPRPRSRPMLSWRARQWRRPGRHSRTCGVSAATATPSSPNKRPAATVGNDAPRVAASDGKGNCILGPAQRCGSGSSPSRDGGSPRKTNRLTPARAADAASGAAGSRRAPPKKVPRRNWRRSAARVPRSLPLTEPLNTRSLTRLADGSMTGSREDVVRPFAGDFGVRGPWGDCGHADGLPCQHTACRGGRAAGDLPVRDLNYDLKRLQAARSYALAQMADTLHDLGYKGLHATGLKRKHAMALVNEWKRQGRSVGTMNPRCRTQKALRKREVEGLGANSTTTSVHTQETSAPVSRLADRRRPGLALRRASRRLYDVAVATKTSQFENGIQLEELDEGSRAPRPSIRRCIRCPSVAAKRTHAGTRACLSSRRVSVDDTEGPSAGARALALGRGRVYLAFSPTREGQWSIAVDSVNARSDDFGIAVFNGKYRRQFDLNGIQYEFEKRNRTSGHLVIDRDRVLPTLQAVAAFDHTVLSLRRLAQNRNCFGTEYDIQRAVLFRWSETPFGAASADYRRRGAC